MYVTRKLSYYRSFPGAMTESPPEGPGSGILVIQDEDFKDEEMTCCFGLCPDPYFKQLPFPQNQRLTLEYTTNSSTRAGENGITSNNRRTFYDHAYFIPVLGKSISLNQYYVIRAKGKHKGKVSTSSKEEDKISCCFCTCISDVKPTKFALDSSNIHQQVEVIPKRRRGAFSAKSVTSDGGFPQSFLRRNGWKICASSKLKPNCQIGEALGITRSSREPPVDAHHSSSSPVVVGKWYCPFIFVEEEGVEVKEQVNRNVYYEMTLEQYWEEEEIYKKSDNSISASTLEVNVYVQNPRTLLFGDKEVERTPTRVINGVRWFRPLEPTAQGLGLSTVIVERMNWEQERRGWVQSDRVVEKVERHGGDFKLFVLVERFVLRRMLDGTVVFTCEFKHTNTVRSTTD